MYDATELDSEIGALEERLLGAQEGRPERTATALFLANRYYNRHQLMSKNRRDLDRCISLLREDVIDAPGLAEPDRTSATAILELALYHRAIATVPPGRADMLESIGVLRSFISDAGGVLDSMGVSVAQGLAFALQAKHRFRLGKPLTADVDEAIELAERALDASQELHQEEWLRAMARANVAGVRRYRAEVVGPEHALADLDRAIELLEPYIGVQGSGRQSIDWPRRAVFLAACLRDRAFVERGGGREDHHRSIGLLREAVEAKGQLVERFGEGHRRELWEWEQLYSAWVTGPAPVGVSIEDRWLTIIRALGHPLADDLDDGRLADAGRGGKPAPPVDDGREPPGRAAVAAAARDERRLRDALGAGDWEAALTALPGLAVSVWASEQAPEAAATRLVDACEQFWASQSFILAAMRLVGKRPRSWERVREVAVVHVISLVVLGRVPDALAVLDRVRAPGLSTLLRTRAERRLPGLQSKVDALRARTLNEILDEDPESVGREARSLGAELEQLQAGLRGFSVDDPVLQARRELRRDDSPTLALLPSARGTLVVVEAPDGQVSWRLLPGASASQIRGLRHTIDRAHDHMVRSVAAWKESLANDQPIPERYGQQHPLLPLREVVSQTCHWLGASVWRPLRNLLPDEGPIEILPFGDLALLPLHAAILPGGNLLGERWFVRYVPTRVLPIVEHQPEAVETLLVVDELGQGSPGHYLEGLILNDFARRAAMDIRSTTFSDAERWGGAKVLHLAAHGQSHDRDPRGIMLASESAGVAERLGFVELAGADVGPALVVSMACSTARPPADLPDDQASLATALLAAGASGVVAPLWDVPAHGAATVARWFYTEYLGADSPAEALADAQVSIYQREGRLDPGAVAATADLFLAGIDDAHAVELFTATPPLPPAWQTRPWVGIESWAAFAYSGR